MHSQYIKYRTILFYIFIGFYTPLENYLGILPSNFIIISKIIELLSLLCLYIIKLLLLFIFISKFLLVFL